jgi:hypothetical protein
MRRITGRCEWWRGRPTRRGRLRDRHASRHGKGAGQRNAGQPACVTASPVADLSSQSITSGEEDRATEQARPLPA